jgi:ankyrin repeat protein
VSRSSISLNPSVPCHSPCMHLFPMSHAFPLSRESYVEEWMDAFFSKKPSIRRDAAASFKVILAEDALLGEKSDLHRGILDKWFEASQRGNTERLGLLLEAGIFVDSLDWFRRTALHFAVENRNPAACRVLLAAGSDPNVATDGGWTPLMMAAGKGNSHIVTSLLEFGADVNRGQSTRNGQTAMDWAVDESQKSVVDLLRRFGGMRACEIAHRSR